MPAHNLKTTTFHPTPKTACQWRQHLTILRLFLLLILILVTAWAPPLRAGEVTLEWDPSPSTGVTGYRIYYGTAPHEYKQTIEVGLVTSHTLKELDDGVTYYFAVTAFNADSESEFSNEVSTTIRDTTPPTIILEHPAGARIYPTTMNRFRCDGRAEDPSGISRVSWYCTSGASGDAAGTGEWSISDLPLLEGYNEIAITAWDGSGNSATLRLTAVYTPTGVIAQKAAASSLSPLYHWRQCEAGDATPPLARVDTLGASGGAAIAVPVSAANGGALRLTLSANHDDLYAAWIRLRRSGTKPLKLSLAIDQAPPFTWTIAADTAGGWSWEQPSEEKTERPRRFALKAGTHTLTITPLSGGGLLDRLLLTTDLDFRPSDEHPDNVPPAGGGNLRLK